MLWPQQYCRFLSTTQEVGRPLRFLWGGQNLQTRFSHFKVQPGDFIYPLCVQAKTVYVVACMKVKAAMTRSEYIHLHPEDSYLIRHSCASEVLVGSLGTTIRFDMAVPQEMLERWRFQSQKQERGLKFIIDGKLTRTISLQGVYHLSAESAQDLAKLLNGKYEPSPTAPVSWSSQIVRDASFILGTGEREASCPAQVCNS